MDSHLRTPPCARAVRVSARSGAGTVVVGAAGSGKDFEARREALKAAGAEVVLLASDDRGRVDVRAVAGWLAERGALDVMIEGGGELAASFWQADLVDEYWCFLAPKIIGGRDAQTPVEGDGLGAAMADARTLKHLTIRRFGQDVALMGRVNTTRLCLPESLNN
jgi:diaminohydroxyphosphoribosylaminopyrimidine deaminase/5-amino-6-(5-phosphoribosylamino)uracil reductase